MTSYIDRSLGDDETVVYRARFPWPYHVVSWLWLVGLGLVLVGIYVFFQRQTRAWTTEMGVTSHRVVLKRGWLSVSTEELALHSIEEVNVEQTFWGRLLG